MMSNLSVSAAVFPFQGGQVQQILQSAWKRISENYAAFKYLTGRIGNGDCFSSLFSSFRFFNLLWRSGLDPRSKVVPWFGAFNLRIIIIFVWQQQGLTNLVSDGSRFCHWHLPEFLRSLSLLSIVEWTGSSWPLTMFYRMKSRFAEKFASQFWTILLPTRILSLLSWILL